MKNNLAYQIVLGVIIIASMYCSIVLLMMKEYLVGGVLAFVCLFCVKQAQKLVKRTVNQSVKDNVSRETFVEHK